MMNSEDNSFEGSNSQNPIGVWQGLWAKLFWQIMEELSNRDSQSAYRTLRQLRTMLPPDVDKDSEEAFKQLDKTLSPTIHVYSMIEAHQYNQRNLAKNGFNAITECLTVVKNSLYDRKWINKDWGIHPDSNKKARIGFQ
jgi:hypothetical protein